MAMEPSFNRRADELIVGGRYADARALLEAAIQKMPTGWTPRREDDQFLTLAFWDQKEFLAHSHREIEMKGLTKSIAWVDGSYSRAWYQLAVVASKEGRFENALFCIDCGGELEPDHPELWNEKGYLLGRLKRHQEAFDCHVRAASVRDWAPPSQIARALRGHPTPPIWRTDDRAGHCCLGDADCPAVDSVVGGALGGTPIHDSEPTGSAGRMAGMGAVGQHHTPVSAGE